MSRTPMRPCRRCFRASLRTRLSLTAFEERLAPANFFINTGDTAGLIAAINTANSNNQPDTIYLGSGPPGSIATYTFTAPAVPGGLDALPPIVLDSGNPANSLTIEGNRTTLARSSAAGTPQFRLMSISGAPTTLLHLTVQGGSVPSGQSGGGVRAADVTLTMNDCNFYNNQAQDGAGLFLTGTFRATITDCEFVQNHASRSGGGLLGINSGTGDSSLTISGTLIERNQSFYGTGGIGVAETSLNMSTCVVRSNTAMVDGGLVVSNSRPVATSIADSAISNNDNGGALLLVRGGTRAQVTGCTISNNVGIGLTINGRVDLTNCTIDGNGSDGPGVIIGVDPVVCNFVNCTITNNSSYGLFIFNGGTAPTLRNTVIAGNGYADVSGPVVSLGYNFIGDNTDAVITGNLTGNQVGTHNAPLDPRLGLLKNNRGPTLTRLPLAGSPLLNAGDPAFTPAATDQRGLPRVQVGRVDIGAAEAQVPVIQSLQFPGLQRSSIAFISMLFEGRMTLPAAPTDAFRITRTGPSGPTGDVTLNVSRFLSNVWQSSVQLMFSGPLTEFGSLIDGNYTLTIFGNQITGDSGYQLDGDGNGVPGGNMVVNFHRLFGDFNGDKAVNGLDLTTFRGAFGTTVRSPGYLSYLDLNGDGAINGLDLAEFRIRFGTSLP